MLIAAPDPLHEPLTLACIELRQADPAGEADRQHARRAADASSTPRWRPAAGWSSSASCGTSTRRTSRCARPCSDGSIGQVKAAHCIHRNARSHPSHTDESVLFGSMIHEFDSVPWLLDDPLAAVTVFASRVPDGALKDLQVAVSRPRAAPS